MEDIKFVVDDSVRNVEELDKEISELIRFSPEIENAAEFLIEFVRGCILATDKLKQENRVEIEKPRLTESDLPRSSYVIVSYSGLDLVKVSVGKVNDNFLYFVDEQRPNDNLIKYVKHFVGFNVKNISNFKYLRRLTIKGCDKLKLKFEEELVLKIYYFVYREYFSLLKLDPLLRDKNVKSIFCDGLYKPIKIYYNGVNQRVDTNLVFSNIKELELIIKRLARLCDASISVDAPVLDSSFSDFRVHAILGTETLKPKFVINRK